MKIKSREYLKQSPQNLLPEVFARGQLLFECCLPARATWWEQGAAWSCCPAVQWFAWANAHMPSQQLAAKPTNTAFSTVVNTTCHGYEQDSVLHEGVQGWGKRCYTALLLAVLLTHMTALARSWNMNMCGMTLLFIINPCPTVGNRENAFPRLRRSSLEHLRQLLCLITLGTENNSRSCAGGAAFAFFPG